MECRVTSYKVVECGYYRYNANSPDFGGYAAIVPQLENWVMREGLNLGDTCTYNPVEGDDILRTFCFDIASRTSESYLVTTWNETALINGKAATVDGHDRVGEATIHLTDIPENQIPGYPTYFWLLPSQGLLSTITFGSPLNGHPNFIKFMNGFLELFSNHVVCDSSIEPATVEGYVESGGPVDIVYYPRFKSILRRNATPIELIKKKRTRIRKTIRKTTLKPTMEETLSFWEKIYATMTGLSDKPLNAETRVKYEIAFTPSAAELNGIVSQWKASDAQWDDVGFEFQGEGNKVIWLSSSLVRSDFDLPIEADDAPIIRAEVLLQALEERKSDILGTLIRDR